MKPHRVETKLPGASHVVPVASRGLDLPCQASAFVSIAAKSPHVERFSVQEQLLAARLDAPQPKTRLTPLAADFKLQRQKMRRVRRPSRCTRQGKEEAFPERDHQAPVPDRKRDRGPCPRFDVKPKLHLDRVGVEMRDDQ